MHPQPAARTHPPPRAGARRKVRLRRLQQHPLLCSGAHVPASSRCRQDARPRPAARHPQAGGLARAALLDLHADARHCAGVPAPPRPQAPPHGRLHQQDSARARLARLQRTGSARQDRNPKTAHGFSILLRAPT
eukprot:5846326-Prymnesium_polylepis.1